MSLQFPTRMERLRPVHTQRTHRTVQDEGRKSKNAVSCVSYFFSLPSIVRFHAEQSRPSGETYAHTHTTMPCRTVYHVTSIPFIPDVPFPFFEFVLCVCCFNLFRCLPLATLFHGQGCHPPPRQDHARFVHLFFFIFFFSSEPTN